MKAFKLIDFYGSIILITAFSINAIIRGNFENTIMAYVVTGAWQLISMIFHLIMGWFTKRGGTRFIYTIISIVCVVTIPAGSVWVLVFTSPFMAIFYTWLCGREIYIRMKRPMDALK